MLLAFVITAVIAAILTGVFDPRPAGPPASSIHPGPLSLPGRGETLGAQSLPGTAPMLAHSVHLTARYVSGELDSGYGLALGTEHGLTVAVTPTGYVAVWEFAAPGSTPVYHMPWQPWPHVRAGTANNEIWLDVTPAGDRDRVVAWVNRERVWQGEVAALPDGVALWLASFGNAVTVDFVTLTWFGAGH